MRNTILTAVLSAVVLVITPAATRAGIIITFSDASNSFKAMTFEMDSVDISTITSASALETVLGTASDYSQITWFFTSAPTPISAGHIGAATALPVTTFDQTLETFTSVLPADALFNWQVGGGGSSISTAGGTPQLATTVFNPNETVNAYTFGGSTIDGTITAIVPETSTLVMGGIALATFLARSGLRRWRGRHSS